MKRQSDAQNIEKVTEEFIKNNRDKQPTNINIEKDSDIKMNSNIDIESNIKINIKSNIKKEPKTKQSPYFVNVSSEYVLAITELIESSGYNKRELTEMALDLLFKKFGVEIVKG